MNMRKLRLIPVLCILLLSSCVKRGCTDKDGENYEPEADKDCSCCFYYGKAYIWYKDPYYNSLGGVSKLFYYADNVLVGESTKDLILYSWYSSEPTVNEDHFVVHNADDGNILIVNMDDKKLKASSVVVKDQNGNIRWTGTVNFRANKIIKIELK